MTDRDWALTSLYHTVINCRDLDESVGFYRRLGFEVLDDRRGVEWPQFVAELFGLERAQGRGVLMVLPSDPDGPMLDLIEWVTPTAAFPDPAASARTVPRIIAFRCRNLRQARAELAAAGVPFVSQMHEPGEALGVLGSICARDPNGNLVELIELAPGVRHSRANQALAAEAHGR
ncbi:MAG TPA: VOC family protein [Caulobacteraceae bacterium]|nr:VOC family protein [Caulobacteraceae bacterium]